ncbi:DExH-box ATP-dependent RNA helicase DExH18, mitochondrial [Neltuma alba]|uniref:DExH-box ATP-dependent RNA helicase DExH18, mitochondrial n=1 Tax=Neltuma alba TaxID=207710 RepID=UPI0010A5026B|nr:DExH-box ATP-dependent RNA helicase DExH18, mitochondrial [Prosopis alba]XP_028806434.1 DExH-box ATP-dependent RNA helicase DExH18, mitochondrial [Prosopis alba]XP_028806435.1 DExH-box ATP-dependent RNA helicase DExH18, mitochondrial [Prosopis alba]XP_028806436.1 DExH-box ATP-dependent RNA helicase DExH18, mitochondrial [Prosopis alba]XP_028806437.1 DExH-box ATP-dependent RNA helicase DExH18, mitochondrial [Prosopis alba]XP_028806438.1 DExH-box ATP-dependent RNA helicase DExH18, mitochondri
MAKGPAFSLFRVCSHKRSASRFPALLLNHHHSYVGQPECSFASTYDVPVRPFSTRLVNPVILTYFTLSSKASSGKVLFPRLFSSLDDSDNDDLKDGTLAESEFEYDADAGRPVDFELEKYDNVSVSSLDGARNDVNDPCNSAVLELEKNVDNDDADELAKDEKCVQLASRDPVDLYRELCNVKGGPYMDKEDWEIVQEVFHYFASSGWASNQALAIYIGLSFFPTAVHKFRDFFARACPSDLANYIISLGPSDAAVKFLFPIFVEYCLENFPDEIKKFRTMYETADLRKPHTWFPFARAMKRKIIYHCGPTNSGKTYNALQRFTGASKGIYCSPLRLLAMEVFDKVNAMGVYCSLLTGQEKKYVPFSSHVACTVEMVSTNALYDVAVIDEIQMMADPYRGHAWTRALLGLKADEIHLCGDPSVLNIVRKICQETGDELCEQHYKRFKPLVVEAKTLLGDLQNIRSGDCVVAFSRREIFEVKLAIEKHTKHRCCVIYGSLPPETRRQQASLFNDQDNEYDVLVASDAVGMGLNLNIRRVVFNSLSKYNGDKIVPVPASQVKQIAGRAGRRGCIYPDGLTTTLHLDDLDYLIDCLKQPFDDVKKVGLFPCCEQIELFAGKLPNLAFSQLLEKFGESCRLDHSYFMCRYDHIRKIANMLDKVPGLSLKDRFNFSFTPVNVRDPKAMYHLLRFATTYSQNGPVNIAMGMPKGCARNDAELIDLETRHQVLSAYLWLSNQFNEDNFPYVKKAEAMANDIAKLLGQSLSRANWKPESRGNAAKGNTAKKEGQPASTNAVELKTEKKGFGYARPQSLIKLFNKKQHEKSLQLE